MKSKRDRDKITNRRIIRKISEKCGYHMYEVEDILNALYATLYDEIVQGNSIEFERLFIVEVKDSKQAEMNRQGVWITYPKRKTLKMRVSRTLEDELRRIARANEANEKYTPAPYGIDPNPEEV